MPALRDAGEALWAAQRRFAWRSSVFVPATLLVTVAAGGWSLATGRIDVGGYVAAIGYTYLVLGGLDGVEAAAGLGAGTRKSGSSGRSAHRSPWEDTAARSCGHLPVGPIATRWTSCSRT